jgi:hypothetical protein
LSGAVILGGVAALILVAGANGTDDRRDEQAAIDAAPVDQDAAEPAQTPGSPTSGAAAPDELCLRHSQFVAVLEPNLPVDSPTELETVTEAFVEFYGGAADLVEEPAASAFRAVFGYYEATRIFHETNGWDVQLDLVAAAALPRPQGDTLDLVHSTLATRCGVEALEDTPTSG